MIALIALTVLAIALLPAWAPHLGVGATIGRILNRTSETLAELSYANRRIRELQVELPEPPATEPNTPQPKV